MKKSINQKSLVAVTNGQTAKAKSVKIKTGKVNPANAITVGPMTGIVKASALLKKAKAKVTGKPIAAPVVAPVAPVAVVAPVAPLPVHVGDAVSYAPDSGAWNSPLGVDKPLDLNDCALSRWDVKPMPLTLPGNVDSGLAMLVCSDNGLPLGKENAKGEVMGRIAFNPHSYYVFDNHAMIALADAVVTVLDKLGVTITPVVCGSYANRSRTSITFKIEKHDTFKIANREFKQFINFLNSFDKTCQLTVTNSTICVCCKNTFAASLCDESGAFKMSVSHDKNMMFPVSEIPKLIECAFKCQEAFKARLTYWHKMPVTLTQAETIFAAFLGKPQNEVQAESIELSTRALNTIDTMKALYGDKGQGNGDNNALTVFSAVTDFYTHHSAGGDDASKQVESSEFGAGSRAKLEFYEALTAWTATEKAFIGTCRIGETILLATAKAIKTRAEKK